MEDLLRSFWGVLGGIFSREQLPPNFSEVALRSLLQNLWNFSKVAPEVRPAVHTVALRLSCDLQSAI